ncbi:hypothetical protein [Rubripirellula tenax]|nr:hypothetical protein [Rubripirellula tenax]
MIGVLFHRHQKKKEEQRRTTLGEVAQELNLVFQEFPTGLSLATRLSPLPQFAIGRKQQITNLLVAETSDVCINLFDYQYTTGHGKNRRVHRETIAAVLATDLKLPTFHLRPEGTLDRLGSMIGMQDIDFHDHPEFSNAFVLKADNEASVRELLDRPLLDHFASRPGISFEATNGLFVYFRKHKQVEHTVDAMRAFLGEGFQTLQALQERLERV